MKSASSRPSRPCGSIESFSELHVHISTVNCLTAYQVLFAVGAGLDFRAAGDVADGESGATAVREVGLGAVDDVRIVERDVAALEDDVLGLALIDDAVGQGDGVILEQVAIGDLRLAEIDVAGV